MSYRDLGGQFIDLDAWRFEYGAEEAEQRFRQIVLLFHPQKLAVS